MDYTFSSRPVKLRACDCSGCSKPGDYRAPRSREHLSEYYWFCLDHVREYNRQWDYFSGMNSAQIEEHIRSATVWERPSWPMGEWAIREQNLRDQVMREFFGEGSAHKEPPPPPMPTSEREALNLLELTPPVTFAVVKAQYRVMVKRHHPDANSGSREAEEKFKNINQAFTVLKQMYGASEDA